MSQLHSRRNVSRFGRERNGQGPRPEVRIIRAPELGNSSFLVADPEAGEAIVIDPFRDIERYLAGGRGAGGEDRAGSRHPPPQRLRLRLPGARRRGRGGDRAAEEGAELAVGRFTVRALRTPGHTPTHLSYLVCRDERPLALFSGGALMVGAIARTDLFGPHLAVHLALEAFRTLKVRLHGLPDDVAVYPTHGGGSFCGASSSTETETTPGPRAADQSLPHHRRADALPRPRPPPGPLPGLLPGDGGAEPGRAARCWAGPCRRWPG